MAYTEMEMQVLNILADQHGEEWLTEDGKFPQLDTYLLTTDGSGRHGTIFEKFDLDPKVYRGVIASLFMKDAVDFDEYDVNRQRMLAVAITESAFNEIRKAGA
ncbi:MAG: hypothetical protein CMF19_03900 [Idiomarinaceae bacterium]|nr:hypothetical protein [Idiomarinaceae bacterium]